MEVTIIMNKSRPSQSPSGSDERVPVVQLCCLPLAEVLTLDLSTTEDFSILLEVLTYADEVKALTKILKESDIVKKNQFELWLKQTEPMFSVEQ